MKFTLEIELEDERYCNGCAAMNLDYEWCLVLREYMHAESAEWVGNVKLWKLLRHKDCPLRKVEDGK